MNKRERLTDIRQKILAKAIELFSDDMPFAEAQRQAAQQVAAQERLKPRDMPRTEPAPTSISDNTSNLREELLAKILGIKQRQERASSIGGRIKRYIFHGDDPDDLSPISGQGQPTPAPSKPPPLEGKAAGFAMGCYTGPSGGGEMIPDAEFPVGLTDTTTANWRRSIEASKPRVPTNEIDPTDRAAVERALQRQQANIIPFRIMK
jgi:hypothetical protein